jgi:hypothetical protein
MVVFGLSCARDPIRLTIFCTGFSRTEQVFRTTRSAVAAAAAGSSPKSRSCPSISSVSC